MTWLPMEFSKDLLTLTLLLPGNNCKGLRLLKIHVYPKLVYITTPGHGPLWTQFANFCPKIMKHISL